MIDIGAETMSLGPSDLTDHGVLTDGLSMGWDPGASLGWQSLDQLLAQATWRQGRQATLA